MSYSFYVRTSVCILLVTACSYNAGRWVEEHGYGPVTEKIETGEPDEELARQGRQAFDYYCSICHRMDSVLTGPPLGRVAGRRKPEFIVNYILNPRENRLNHPAGVRLGEQYSGIMAETGISEEQARAVYEYLRFYSENRENPEKTGTIGPDKE